MSHPNRSGAELPSHLSDSAGQPWAGRHFDENASAADDGAAPAAIADALRAFAAGSGTASDVVEAARDSRFLIPLVAHLGDEGVNERGVRIDKKQELSIVTVAGPDGRDVLPVFTSVDAMARWNPRARPVPADGRRVALAATAESTEIVVIDPLSEHEFALRRPALWAIARNLMWSPGYEDPEVVAAFRVAAEQEPAVRELTLHSGDPTGRLRGPETLVMLSLIAGLDRAALGDIVTRLGARWAADDVIAARIDSLTVRFVAGD